MTLTPESLAALRAVIGDRVQYGDGALAPYRGDASHIRGAPDAVVRPSEAREVVALVGWARKYRVPLVARGAGTSLDGESVPLSGVVVDLAGWTKIRELDPVDRVARVEPGVINFELQRAARAAGLFFPPNPGSWRTSTLGGNAATNASGPRSFRYGPMRAWVRAAEVVLGTGERLQVGSRAAKRSIGPDLLQLLLGSEGTLGIFTELTVALVPIPARRTVLGVPLPEGVRLAPLVAGLSQGLADGLSAIEYLDRRCADALARTPGARLPGGHALLLLELESATEAEESDRLERTAARLAALGAPADPVVFPEADAAWSLRGESGTALDRELGTRVREDLAVPIGRIDELLATIARWGRAQGVETCVYGHLGEGSFHPNLALDPGSPEGEAVRARLLREALRLGGVISSEHGIGSVKSGLLAEQIGPGGLRLLDGIARACDPDRILNPGKLLPR